MTLLAAARALRVRLLALAVLACMLVLSAPAGAQENCTSEPCPPAGDLTPPTITISPGSGTYGGGALPVTIDWSDNNLLDPASRVITYGGANVTSQFSFNPVGGQGWTAQSTGTVIVEPGSRHLVATICDASSRCTTDTVTYAGPPTVTVSPAGGTYGVGALAVTIDWSGHNLLDPASRTIMYGSENVTTQFTWEPVGGQGRTARSRGSVPVAAGSRTLSATICDASSRCSTGAAAYAGATSSVSVTPETATLSVPASTRGAARFRVMNTGAARTTYGISAGCSTGFTSCSPARDTLTLAGGEAAWVEAAFQTHLHLGGQVYLSATAGPANGTGTATINTLQAPDPGYVGDNRSLERIERAACVTVGLGPSVASECGDLRVVHALPTTTVLNRARTPVLTYNSDHALPHPVVAAQFAGPATVPARVRARLMLGAAVVADTVWPGWGASQTRRIALSFNASSYKTGLYPYQLVITAERSDGSQETLPASRNGRMIIVNRSASPFGVGWWLAGVEQLIDVPGDTLKLWVGGDGSARLYRGASLTGPWGADGYERPDSIHRTASGHYVRTLAGRSQVWFDATGRHVRTVNPLQQYTEFQWVTLGRHNHLQQIVTPYASGANDVVRYVFEYNNPADTVRRLSLVTAPAAGGTARDTRVQADGMGRVTAIMDTDTVRFAYATGLRWMGQRTDRGGPSTTSATFAAAYTPPRAS